VAGFEQGFGHFFDIQRDAIGLVHELRNDVPRQCFVAGNVLRHLCNLTLRQPIDRDFR
jgi:hypothetical protein